MADDYIQVEGKIVAVLPGTMFRVQLSNGHQVLGHISGKLRKHFIKIGVGDMVKMEMSPYDLEKARIIYRLKGGFSEAPRLDANGVAIPKPASSTAPARKPGQKPPYKPPYKPANKGRSGGGGHSSSRG